MNGEHIVQPATRGGGGKRTCQITDCPKPVRSRNLCESHYIALHRREKAGYEVDWTATSIPAPRPAGRPRIQGDTCRIDDCELGPYGRGYCPKHYGVLNKRERRGEHVDWTTTVIEKRVGGRPKRPVEPCRVAECDTLAKTRGYCRKHYSRMQRAEKAGTVVDWMTTVALPGRAQKPKRCSREGCEGQVRSRGLCNRHYLAVVRGRTSRVKAAPKPKPVTPAPTWKPGDTLKQSAKMGQRKANVVPERLLTYTPVWTDEQRAGYRRSIEAVYGATLPADIADMLGLGGGVA